MKEYIMLVGASIWAVFTSEFDTSVTSIPVVEDKPVDWNIEISMVTAVYILACLLALIIGGLVN